MVIAVPVGPGDRMKLRMPSPEERQAHQLAEGEPAIEIQREDGAIEVHPIGMAEVMFVEDTARG